MKKMTLKEIQLTNLDIMKDIHSFCETNGIHYSLAYGSLIGAIRHKGFIPWDDDIDIMMPRPDFERFSREYKSTSRYRLSSVYDSDTYINYTRVYDNNTIVISPGKSARFKIGLWVDVYPIDGISDNEIERKTQFKEIRQYTTLVMQWRRALGKVKKHKISDFLKGCFQILKIRLSNKTSFRFWHERIIQLCKENSFGTTRRCSSLVCVEANKYNKQEIFETSDFHSFKLVPFEDQVFYVASGYDNILTTIYGDYMKMPPKEKQVSHINFQQIYWR